MPENDPTHEPHIHDRTERPQGVVPKNAQALVLGLIALVMVLIISFTGRSTPSKEPRVPPPVAVPSGPNSTTIIEFGKGIDERAKKLAEAKAALEEEQKKLLRLNAAPGQPLNSGPGYFAPSSGGRYRTDDVDSSPSRKTPAQLEKEKREAQAPYASSIALSYRQTSPPTISPFSASSVAPGPGAKSPTLLDLLSNDAMLANAAAAQFGPVSTPRAAPVGNSPGFVPPPAAASLTPSVPSRGNTSPGRKRYTLFEASIIETALTNRLDATFSGPVVCIVTTDVYSQSGGHLLIPRGSRVVGEVRQVDSFGQQRVAVSFHRLLLPNEQSIQLDQFQGLNQIGETGLRDQVNHHYMQMFGAAIAVGAISGLAQSNTRYGTDASAADVYRQGVGSSLAQSSMRILDRFLNILPTFTIREGHRIKVYLAQDLELPEYDDEGGY